VVKENHGSILGYRCFAFCSFSFKLNLPRVSGHIEAFSWFGKHDDQTVRCDCVGRLVAPRYSGMLQELWTHLLRKAEGRACSSMWWHDPPHPLKVPQAWHKLWHGEIHESHRRREAKYTHNMQLSITEVQAQSNDRVRDMRNACGSIAADVQTIALALQKVVKKF
jgi:hypothetical protein